MGHAEMLFDEFTRKLMDTPVVIVASVIIMFGAIIYQVFFEGRERVRQLRVARRMLVDTVHEHSCAPILLRLAWADAGTYDKARASMGWPNAGGCVGGIRTKHALDAPPNAGLMEAISTYLSPIKEVCPEVSWADLVQMGGAVAVEESGGPKINMRYGRTDAAPSSLYVVPHEEWGLPQAEPPFPSAPTAAHGEKTATTSPAKGKTGSSSKGSAAVKHDASDAAAHLKATFAKYGMDAEDIVALSGGHTLGRSFQKKHVCPAAHSKKINAAKKKKKESSPLRSMSSPPSSTSSSPSSPKAAAAVGDVVAKSPRAEAPGGAGVKASDCNSTDAEESESEVEEEESPHEESDHEEDDDNPEGTIYTSPAGCPYLMNSTTVGGKSWTKNWLVFDNSYFTELSAKKRDADLLALPTDLCLRNDKTFKPYFEKYAADQESFFAAYAESHRRFSELGAAFFPGQGIYLESSWNVNTVSVPSSLADGL